VLQEGTKLLQEERKYYRNNKVATGRNNLLWEVIRVLHEDNFFVEHPLETLRARKYSKEISRVKIEMLQLKK